MKIKSRHLVIMACAVLIVAIGVLVIKVLFTYPENEVAITSDNNTGKTAAEQGEVILPESDSLEPITENENLVLYLNPATTEIAVKDKRDGFMWYSNPQKRTEDPLASGFIKDKLSSQLSLTYVNRQGQPKDIDNYSESITNKQYEIRRIKDGVKITYTLGKAGKGLESIPKVISRERFEKLILNRTKNDKDREEIDRRFGYDKESGICKRRDIPDFKIKNIIRILEEAGYTEKDLEYDNKENNVTGDSEDSTNPSFVIPIEYRLDGEELVVRVPSSEICHPDALKITNLSLLEYFGAADTAKKGYIFVPDGSGSLIYLNNNKTKAPAFTMPVYDEDRSIFKSEKIAVTEKVRMPVFGLKDSEHAFIGIIEDGDAIASISAGVSGSQHSYNNVYSRYMVTARDDLMIKGNDGKNYVPLFQKNIYQGDIKVRYGFLNGDKADYVGMAHYYQGYLADRFGMKRLEAGNDAPFFLELMGNIPYKKSFLGIPYETYEPLTTYDDAVKILEKLKKGGIGNIKLLYNGWYNGGIWNSVSSEIKPDKQLGGEKGLLEFIKYVRKADIGFYPEASFLRVYKERRNGFKPTDDCAKYLSGKPVIAMNENPATFQIGKWDFVFSHFALSPSKLDGVIDGFLKDYSKLGIDSIALKDLGDELNSDFNKNKPVDRQQALKLSTYGIKKVESRYSDLLIKGGNAYAVPYARNIVEVPMDGSQFIITDVVVPFYQIVLHGYVDYAGKAMNYSDDQDPHLNMLRALETGSNVYYQWFYAPASAIKKTVAFDNYTFASHYDDWIDESIKIYSEVNKALGNVRDSRITSHRIIQDGVNEVGYENGVRIIVNYNKEPAVVDGHVIEAQNYWIGGEQNG